MARHQGDEDAYGQQRFDSVKRTENQMANANSDLEGYPGARNFSGASRNEMASTRPSQTKVRAAVIAAPRLTMRPRSVQGGPGTGPVRRTHPAGQP